jgi:hypothetical protein
VYLKVHSDCCLCCWWRFSELCERSFLGSIFKRRIIQQDTVAATCASTLSKLKWQPRDVRVSDQRRLGQRQVWVFIALTYRSRHPSLSNAINSVRDPLRLLRCQQGAVTATCQQSYRTLTPMSRRVVYTEFEYASVDFSEPQPPPPRFATGVLTPPGPLFGEILEDHIEAEKEWDKCYAAGMLACSWERRGEYD